MTRIILVTGGARSGKSALAERLTLDLGHPATYIATAEAGDAEMAARIARHQASRSGAWTTHAEPRDLTGALTATDGSGSRLVDCLTLWLSNLMLGGQEWERAVAQLVTHLDGQASPVVFVTTEVGAGIVPDSALARAYRDAAGWMNQRLAEASDEVWMSVAGCPFRLKPSNG